MALTGIHHVNINCGAADLPAIERFYNEGLGMRTGYRPDFPSKGVWLYVGDHPLVHVTVRSEGNWSAANNGYDHIAFRVTGLPEIRGRLERIGAVFDEQNVPQAGFQIFTHDPVGNKVELNFPNEEAPEEVAKGTLSRIQFPDQPAAAH